MSIELDDYDRKILKDCPLDIDTSNRYSRSDPDRMKRIKRLWSAGYVGATVVSKTRLLLVIRDPGRLAIGRPAIEAPAEAADA